MDFAQLTRGQRVRFACNLRDMHFTELAKRTGLSVYTISNIINGDRSGGLDFWLKLADGLGARIGWLIEGEGEIWRAEASDAAQAPSLLPPVQSSPSTEAKALPK